MKQIDTHGLDQLGLNPMRVLEDLGIEEHTEEDCRLSNILSSATKKTLLVEDRMVHIFESDKTGSLSHVVRAEISASDRRKVLAGKPGTVKLRCPSPGNRIEDMNDGGKT